MERRLIAEGEWYEVECAVRTDESSPASEFFDALQNHQWDPGALEIPLEPDEQIRSRDILLVWCQALADTGNPVRRTAVNYLTDGVWEFKRGAIRLTFYDTPGDGSYSPKPPERDGRSLGADWHEFYWFPEFDDFVRLGHAFPKAGQRTSDFDLAECQLVREEDLTHDE